MSVKEERMSNADNNRYGKTYPARRIKREPVSTCEGQCSYSMIKVEKDSGDDAAAVSTHGVYIKQEELECSDTDVPVKVEIDIGPTVIQPQYIGSSLHTTNASKAELIQCGGADVTLGTTTPGAASYSGHSTGSRSVVYGGTSDEIEMKDKGKGNKLSTPVIFFCDICEYKCAFKSRLVMHKFIHTGEKRFSCTICEYKFKLKSQLEVHMRTHTGEKPYSCNICEYKCRVKSRLVEHMRTHTGEKPYSCNICEYKSAVKPRLLAHIRTHTWKKPFSCTICEYKCSLKTHLEAHMRIHTGEKPYSCNICEYKYATNSRLADHIRCAHPGEKPYSCNICEYKCKFITSLVHHKRTMH